MTDLFTSWWIRKYSFIFCSVHLAGRPSFCCLGIHLKCKLGLLTGSSVTPSAPPSPSQPLPASPRPSQSLPVVSDGVCFIYLPSNDPLNPTRISQVPHSSHFPPRVWNSRLLSLIPQKRHKKDSMMKQGPFLLLLDTGKTIGAHVPGKRPYHEAGSNTAGEAREVRETVSK